MNAKTKQIKTDLENRLSYEAMRKKYTDEELLGASDDFVGMDYGEGRRVDIKYNLKNGYCEMYGDYLPGLDEDGYSIREDNKEIRYYNEGHERD